MATWPAEDAKARFTEFLDAATRKGPQMFMQRGIEIAALVPIEEWNRLRRVARPSLKDLLLSPEPRFDDGLIERRKLRRRSVIK